MSFVRFGTDGSQVYVFEHYELGIVCWNCGLAPGAHFFVAADLDAMLTHLAEHRAVGNVVPDWLDDDLRRAWDDPELGG